MTVHIIYLTIIAFLLWRLRNQHRIASEDKDQALTRLVRILTEE